MYNFLHNTALRTWVMFLLLAAHGAYGNTCVPEQDYVTMSSSFSQVDSKFDASDEHTFTVYNGHVVTVTGFDSTKALGYGFRCFERCRLGDEVGQALANVSGLAAGGRYRFRLWQFAQQEELAIGRRNELYVNGEKYETIMGDDIAAYGYATATESGTVEFLFVNTNGFYMGLSWLTLARVCGCASDAGCPGLELCGGTEEELAAGAGRCALGGKCAYLDHRGAEYSCWYMSGAGIYAGNSWCTAWPREDQPLFMPMEMCCECGGGMSWVRTPYQIDNGGFEWQNFGKLKDGSAGYTVLSVGNGHRMRGILTEGWGKNTPKNIVAEAGPKEDGPWTYLATWKQKQFERVWTDVYSDLPFLRLSWEETFGKTPAKIYNIQIELGDRAVDAVVPEGGWTGKFSLVGGYVSTNPRCVIEDGCVTSPNWPESYPYERNCEILVEEDTVLIATHFGVVGDEDERDDYLMIESNVQRSSGVYGRSAGPYHVPVAAGDRLVWVEEGFEVGPGFRVCGYSDNEGGLLPTWPPPCSALTTKYGCKESGCKWKNGKCKAKVEFQCESLKKRKCKRKGHTKGCEWNQDEKICQDKELE